MAVFRSKPRSYSGVHALSRGSDRSRLRVFVAVLAGLVVAAAVVVAVQLLRSVPRPTLSATLPATEKMPGGPAAIRLPSQGSASVGVEGLGMIAETNGARRYPIASVTKLMTALLVLHDHPLKAGSSGPTITVRQSDVNLYRSEKSQGDSVVAVVDGERLSERQALEAMLIPSADNVATMLADWDAGSLNAFVAKMNAAAGRLGLAHTHYADASGVNPGSASTAPDQLRVAEIVMGNPVLRRIVSMPQVMLPVAGLQYNVDADLGHDGIIGVKTGWVPAGGAAFVFAAAKHTGKRHVIVIGDVLGQRGGTPIDTALSEGKTLSDAVPRYLRTYEVVRQHERVGTVSAPYSSSVPIVTASPVRLLAWQGAGVSLTVHLRHHVKAPLASGSKVGVLKVRLGDERATVPLVTEGRLSGSSLTWRLTRA